LTAIPSVLSNFVRLWIGLARNFRAVGELPQQTKARIDALSLEQLENLGVALLDFEALVDLEVWLSALE
jgi:hypothetical protein